MGVLVELYVRVPILPSLKVSYQLGTASAGLGAFLAFMHPDASLST